MEDERTGSPEPENPDRPDKSAQSTKTADGPKPRRWLAYTVFCLTLLLALILHHCESDRVPTPNPTLHGGVGKTPEPPKDSVAAPETTSTSPKPPEVKSTVRKAVPAKPDTSKPTMVAALKDSGQSYVYADPWGGRHFDSVHVTLHCRENCLILYSLEDSVHFKSYENPFTFKRNTTLWISGIDSLNRQVAATRIDYVIERNPGACPPGSMPIEAQERQAAQGSAAAGSVFAKTICVDEYEWPNKEDEFPNAFVNQKEAADSCAHVGKRLCSANEWHQACEGPDHDTYPYGRKYNENHCPSKEKAAVRSGRFPACRSYYGLYDMTGNVWEWTSSPAPNDSDFYLVEGGNWDAGNEATCSYAKFSFYPKVRYPFVGFRCCADAVVKDTPAR